MFIQSSPKFTEHFNDHYLKLFWVDCLSPLCIALLEFYLVLLLQKCSFVTSFCWFFVFISMYVCMYEVGQACFLILEKGTSVGNVLWVPKAHFPLFTRAIALEVLPISLCARHGPFFCSETNYCGCSAKCGYSPASLVVKSCLMWELLATGGQGRVLR